MRYIQGNTRIPVMGHAAGVCHVYLHSAADAAMAAKVGLSKSAVRNGLAADEDVRHGAIMAPGTDSCFEIDGRAMFAAIFCSGVDLETE